MSAPVTPDPGGSAPGPQEARLGPIRVWVLLLAGPVLWGVHFMAVYLLTEAVCGIEGMRFRLLGLPGVPAVVTGLTVVALLVIAWFSFRAWQEWRAGRQWGEGTAQFVGLGGVLLGLLSLLAVASVGLPALVLSPC